MDVRIVKLVTGEELLTQVVEGDDSVALIKPIMLIPHQQGLQMIPWLTLMYAKYDTEKVTISADHVLFMYEPKEELSNGYRQQVGSIVTAPANALDNKGKLIL